MWTYRTDLVEQVFTMPPSMDITRYWYQTTCSCHIVAFMAGDMLIFIVFACQRCSTWVQDLDSSPTRATFFGTWTCYLWTCDLWTCTWTWHLWTWDFYLTHPDLNLIFKVFLNFSLMENPDSHRKFLIIYVESRLERTLKALVCFQNLCGIE